jgi:hypothetical protein
MLQLLKTHFSYRCLLAWLPKISRIAAAPAPRTFTVLTRSGHPSKPVRPYPDKERDIFIFQV